MWRRLLRKLRYILLYMCPPTTMCVFVLLYMCPHITAESSEADVEEAVAHIYVLILLYVCPHTTTYMSSYYYMCVLMLLNICPHTTVYYCRCVRGGCAGGCCASETLKYMCPHILLYTRPDTITYIRTRVRAHIHTLLQRH